MGANETPGTVFGSRAVVMLSLVSEAATALAAILVPSILAGLLFGRDVDALTQQIVRLAGVMLLSLVVAVWPQASGATPQAAFALLLYNVLCTLVFIYIALSQAVIGSLLWPAAILHAATAAAQLFTRHRPRAAAVSPAAANT